MKRRGGGSTKKGRISERNDDDWQGGANEDESGAEGAGPEMAGLGRMKVEPYPGRLLRNE